MKLINEKGSSKRMTYSLGRTKWDDIFPQTDK